METQANSTGNASRREFLKSSSAAAVAGTLAGSLAMVRNVHAASNDDTLRVALVGCGGRGTGAAAQALKTEGNVRLVAMAEAFRDNLDRSYTQLTSEEGLAKKIDVPEERKFVGFDAYQQAIDSGCDVVILATPPGFRPQHFDACVKAGKHVFMEKPVATDAAGIRQFMQSAAESKQKNLAVGVGLQRHHQASYIETIKRLQDGAIGDMVSARVYWNQGKLWVRKRAEYLKKNPSTTEMEYQMRNWYYFLWLCGDNIVEQHIHNMDVINWLKGAHPVRANGMGGCEVRRGPDYGETFDHHCVEFEYADGSRMFSQCRHMDGCWGSVAEHVHGTKGTAIINNGEIRVAGGERWKYSGDRRDPYQVEHDVLFASIREGKPINEAEYGGTSTMTAILGRMCTYSGKQLTWDQALESKISVMPTEYSWTASPPSLPGSDGLYKLPIPGVTKVV